MEKWKAVIGDIRDAEQKLRRLLNQQVFSGQNHLPELAFRLRHLRLARKSYEGDDPTSGKSHIRSALDGPNPTEED